MNEAKKQMHDIAVSLGLMVDACTLEPDLEDLVLGAKSLRRRYEESKARIAELEGAREEDAAEMADLCKLLDASMSARSGTRESAFEDVCSVLDDLDFVPSQSIAKTEDAAWRIVSKLIGDDDCDLDRAPAQAEPTTGVCTNDPNTLTDLAKRMAADSKFVAGIEEGYRQMERGQFSTLAEVKARLGDTAQAEPRVPPGVGDEFERLTPPKGTRRVKGAGNCCESGAPRFWDENGVAYLLAHEGDTLSRKVAAQAEPQAPLPHVGDPWDCGGGK